jgi:hypothetical protein
MRAQLAATQADRRARNHPFVNSDALLIEAHIAQPLESVLHK